MRDRSLEAGLFLLWVALVIVCIGSTLNRRELNQCTEQLRIKCAHGRCAR